MPEVFLARLGLIVIPPLSRPVVLRLARFFGGAAYLLARHLRRVGRANLDIAYGGRLTAGEKRRLLKGSFRSFALTILDVFWFSHKTGERITRYVRFGPGCDPLFESKARVCVTAHMGNWEVLGQALTAKGITLTSVAAPLANPAVDRLFNELRTRTGQAIVPQKGAVRRLLQTLRDGGKIALVLDQNTKPSQGGVFLPFFGLDAPISTAAASLAIHTGANIFIGVSVPRPDGSYMLQASPPMTTPSGATGENTVVGFTREIISAVEHLIREHPQAWLWMYKRWKYIAPGRAREDYPFYAKELLPQDRAKARGSGDRLIR